MNDLIDMTIFDAEVKLKQYLAQESKTLLPTLRLYVWRGGLANGSAVNDVAEELLQDVVVEALSHASRFQLDRQPKAWLLGIAANLVKRQQTAVAKQHKREPLVGDLSPSDAITDDELFDRLAPVHTSGPDNEYEMNETVSSVLAQLSTEERRTITCAVLLDMDSKALAQALGVKPGTARMRLHRALKHLRRIWIEMVSEESGYDE